MNKFLVIVAAAFSASLYAADSVFEVPLSNKRVVKINLQDDDPYSLDSFATIIERAHKEQSVAYLVAFPYAKGDGYHICDGYGSITHIAAHESLVNPYNSEVTRFVNIFIGKDDAGEFRVDYSNEMERGTDDFLNKMKRLSVHLWAHVPLERFSKGDNAMCKKISFRMDLAKIWLIEKQFKKAVPLLDSVVDNACATVSQKQKAAFSLGQIYYLGKGVGKDYEKARGYFEYAVQGESKNLTEKALKYIDQITQKKS